MSKSFGVGRPEGPLLHHLVLGLEGIDGRRPAG